LGAVAAKRAVAELAPTLLLAVQLSASAAVLTVVRRLSRGGSRRAPVRFGLLGLLNPGLAYLLGLAGLATITVGLSVLLWALEPVFIVAFAWLVISERISTRTGLLSAGAIAGAVLAGAAGTDGVSIQGVLLTVAAVASCAVYTVASSAWMRFESSLAIVVSQQWFALGLAAVVLGVHAWWSGGIHLTDVSPIAWASAIGSGVVYYGLAFWTYLAGLRHTTAAHAAVFLNLIPLFGVLGGWLFLGEPVTSWRLVGAAIVVGSVVGVTRAVPAPASVGLTL
jgi:drug/metabolite transporter (DMT)-like permease